MASRARLGARAYSVGAGIALWAFGMGCGSSRPQAPKPDPSPPSLVEATRPRSPSALEATSAPPPRRVEPAPQHSGHLGVLQVADRALPLWQAAGAEPHPLVVVAHGAGGSASWHCAHWAELISAPVFLLCLLGTPTGMGRDAYYFPDHLALRQELEAALDALAHSAVAPRLAGQPKVFLGYSQGASMGSLVLADSRVTFDGAVLLEGGFSEWNVLRSRVFRARGGRRVALLCGTRSCSARAPQTVRWMERGGLVANWEAVERAGHRPDGELGVRTAQALTRMLTAFATQAESQPAR